MKTMTNKILTIISAIALSCFFISCGGETHSQQKTEPDSTKVEQKIEQPSSKAVSFTITDTKGVVHNSSEWIGKQPVVINIWGTWCPPCRAEIPAFVKAYDIYNKKGIEFLGIAVRDNKEKVITFAEQNNMKWQMMLLSDNNLVERFNIQAVPTTIFIDRNGNVMKILSRGTKTMVEAFSGAMHYDQFVGHLDSLLTL